MSELNMHGLQVLPYLMKNRCFHWTAIQYHAYNWSNLTINVRFVASSDEQPHCRYRSNKFHCCWGEEDVVSKGGSRQQYGSKLATQSCSSGVSQQQRSSLPRCGFDLVVAWR
ncbi:uncharacterized protein J3R85_001744 [Psidium guajava]|nr:uncharacterized protein J3R85_001744 [Psidium guajava]